MFEKPSFEQRKDSLENGRCTCFPDNEEGPNCLKNCKHRKDLIKKLESEEGVGDNKIDEE